MCTHVSGVLSSQALRPTHSGWEHLLGGEEGLAGSHARQTLQPHLPCPLLGEAPGGGRPLPHPQQWEASFGLEGWGGGGARGPPEAAREVATAPLSPAAWKPESRFNQGC